MGNKEDIMKPRYAILVLVLLLLASFPVQASKVNRADLEATHILVGKVDNVESFFGVNERGDQIILSRVRVKALNWIKGDPSGFVEFMVEGGSVGDIALKVSDVPEFEKGQRLRLLLKKANGEFKYEESEIEEPVRIKPAKPAAGCCKTYAAWPNPPVDFKVNTSGTDVPADNALADIQAGIGEWNTTVSVLNYAGPTNTATAARDGENAVFFSNVSSGSAIAVTYLWYNKRTQVMLEFDMYFFEKAWDFFSRTRGDTCLGGFYYQTIATHEFGHAVGIDHNRCTDSIMYPYASYCGTNTVTAADLACLTKLYQ
jgi:hypothetical protein